MRVENYTAQELFDALNDVDETLSVEAKAPSVDTSRSIMETVCSFSNEPGLGGGVILLGVKERDEADGVRYEAEDIADTDKAQLDFATQCAGMFNFPVRPEIVVEKIDGCRVLKIFVPELPASRKPLYFKKDGIPRGIYRRIGSSDQRCTEEELPIFYNREDTCDGTGVAGTSISDVDEEAVRLYRVLREKARPDAVELTYEVPRLLKSLGCLDRENPERLNLAGVLMFGTKEIQRQLIPAVRVDYLRVPGNEWVQDPERSFISTEMRGSLISVLYRAMDAVRSDLPSGFLLTENDIQAKSIGLPDRALREAIVNALMHRSYRVNRPTQIIRYDNRIEITNAGYSLKPEDELGQDGSEVRNPILADIFHELNLAEEKGSGIRRMRKMMEAAHLAAPTFESDRDANKFTIRLLLHHFLGEEDIKWLAVFDRFDLDDNQKKAMIFLRETGAVDNSVYRQFSGVDTLHASSALRKLRECGLVMQKGKGPATYYVSGENFPVASETLQGTMPDYGGTMPDYGGTMPDYGGTLIGDSTLDNEIKVLKKRVRREYLEDMIVRMCRVRPFSKDEMIKTLKRSEKYLREILTCMVKRGRLAYTIPEMPTHPNQMYRAND